ncbi:MAG: hypothetical protein JWQ18_2902 [Conexibacter sp.]|nr:hypothetical protein [Conexibacter sp.]
MKRLAVAATVLLATLSLTAAAADAAALSGTYQTKLGGQLKGTWTIKFSHGNYKVSDNGKALVRGTYTISGSTIKLGHERGPLACSSTGTYRFKLSGSQLRFTRVSDGAASCAGRAAVLKGHFTKV